MGTFVAPRANRMTTTAYLEIDMTNLIVPHVHLNGDAAEDLITLHGEAMHALYECYDLLSQCAPHGRNFYCHEYGEGEEALRLAQDQHLRRMDTLKRLNDEVSSIMLGIMNRQSFVAIEEEGCR